MFVCERHELQCELHDLFTKRCLYEFVYINKFTLSETVTWLYLLVICEYSE